MNRPKRFAILAWLLTLLVCLAGFYLDGFDFNKRGQTAVNCLITCTLFPIVSSALAYAFSIISDS